MQRDVRRIARSRDEDGSTRELIERASLRWRFWLEAAATFVAGVVALFTVLVPTWAEVLLNIDPDQGNGLFEVGVTLVAVLVAVGCALAARLEWRGRVSRDSSQRAGGGVA